MSCVRTLHTWRCDGCGAEKKLAHGEWAEPRIPAGWAQVIGYGLHACSVECREKVDNAHADESDRRFLWRDPETPNLGFTYRPPEPPKAPLAMPFSETP